MYYTIFLEFIATFLVSYLSQSRQQNLDGMNEYGRIAAYNPPPPPPQLYFPASVDSSEEYHLRSLSTITKPPSLLFASIDSSSKLPETDTSSFLVNSLPRVFNGIFYRLVRIASWILSTAVVILGATLRVSLAIGPLAWAVYALKEISALRKDHDAVAQALQDIHAREKAGEDRIRQLEVTVERQEDATKRCEAHFQAQQTRSREATKKLELDLESAQEHIDRLLSTIESQSQELLERATAQTKAGPSNHSTPPAPTRVPRAQVGLPAQPPAQSGVQPSSQGQRAFTPRPSQIPGLSPDRTRGWGSMENGHPAGRGRVVGRRGGSGGG